jgi:uncharacterized protein YjbI with pentapeptide repeats
MPVEGPMQRRTGWGPLLAVCAALVISCGGGRDSTPPESGIQPAFAVAKLTTARDVLELPLLQSGSALYTDVSIGLADDGTFSVTSWHAVAAAAAPVDGTLTPPVPLESLAGTALPVQLAVRRLHLDNGVYHAVRIEFNKGHWRYLADPVQSQTVSALDLRANATLIATDDHLVVMQSAPGKAEAFPLRLESRSYRFCMDKQEQGADSVTIADPDGKTIATLGAGGPCAAFIATQGLYQVRHNYGGTGQARTVFMRRRAQDASLVAAPAGAPQVLPRSDPAESWGILVSLLNVPTLRVISGSEGFLGDSVSMLGRCTADYVEGVFQATALTPVVVDGYTGKIANRALFDGFNFFTPIRDAGGNVSQLGTPIACPAGAVLGIGFGFYAILSDPFTIAGLEAQGTTVSPAKIGNLASSGSFSLTSTSAGTETPLGDVNNCDRDCTAQGNQVVLRPQTPQEAATAAAQYRVVLRYRSAGVPANAVPAQGQVALFNTADCSGPAMLVDQYDLTGLMDGGSLGSFRGSLKLGALTRATVYSQMFQRGEFQSLNTSGCIPAGWGTTGWKASSLAIQMDTVEMVLSTNQCERCNLAGIDLGGKDLHNAKFAGTNLNDAILASTNLAGADLRNVFLQGAQLPNANLDAANLCGAKLNAAPSSAGSTNVAANLAGAFLRNADLSRSNAAGANFTSSSFFSADQAVCTPSACETYSRPVCATAAAATLDGIQFGNAYLVGVDLSNAHGSGASFSNAVLTGARLNNAILTPLNGTPANFTGSFIQGADFSAADLTGAIFSNAYAATAPGCMQFELDETHTSFPGFAVPVAPDSTQCAGAPPQKACVKFAFGQGTVLPSTVTLGTPTVPLAQALPPNSPSCSVNPLCGAPLPSDRVNTCW